MRVKTNLVLSNLRVVIRHHSEAQIFGLQASQDSCASVCSRSAQVTRMFLTLKLLPGQSLHTPLEWCSVL